MSDHQSASSPAAGLEVPAGPSLCGILDNGDGRVAGEFLRDNLSDAEVRAVSAYFSIYAHQALREELGAVKSFRFLFGDPGSVGDVDPGGGQLKNFLIHEDGTLGRPEGDPLRQKYAAQQCGEWVQSDRVEIRTMMKEFLHGKMFHAVRRGGQPAAFCGSSNFTARGLGFGRGNRELNIVADRQTADGLREWFDALWDGPLSRDAKDDVLAALARLGKNQPPDFIYFLTLFRMLRDELEKISSEADSLGLEESRVWSQLYPFQAEAVYGIIRRLKKWGGCILADSVGLGKTYSALAVIKYFELERVLVLCPKRLEQNWQRFLFDNPDHNPLEADRFRYHVRAHTDLSHQDERIWSKYDLVVIDESHNFRNAAGARYKTLYDGMRRETQTKILMLSATPVNTSLKDIKSQIMLATDDGGFHQELGISSVEQAIKTAQSGFKQWEQQGGKDKDALMEHLGGAFLKLADAFTIARNRRHVRDHYPEMFAGDNAAGRMDDFPRRTKPDERKPPTDSAGELSYSGLHGSIGELGLCVHTPALYLREGSETQARLEAKAQERNDPFKQSDREKILIGLMRANFLKRLESSAHSFCRTLERTIAKIEGVEDKIARVRNGEVGLMTDDRDTPEPDDLAEDDEFMVGKGLQYDLREMHLDDWSRDLARDRQALQHILAQAAKVTAERDAKLAELKGILQNKAQNPPRDKDGMPNRKVLVFTAFSDTAEYLYEQLRAFVRDDLGLHLALVVGSGTNRTTANAPQGQDDCPARHSAILSHFAPRAQGVQAPGMEQIDILIATDCISEGQNLQDCDTVVNYDIHWNPVRIIQRFGRVDRMGGRNREVRRVDFWPHMDLDEYLSLRERVQARMALASAVAAGDAGADDRAALEEDAKAQVDYRDHQLRRLREEALTIDDLDNISMSDFTMADFLAELRAFLESNRAELESAPNGLFGVVQSNPDKGMEPGIIFCLRQKGADGDDELKRNNWAHPHFLVYVRKDGTPSAVKLGFPQAKKILRIFGDLCRNESEPLSELCDAFDTEIQNGENMQAITDALHVAVADIARRITGKVAANVGPHGDGQLLRQCDIPQQAADFELVSWLVVR